MTSGVKAGEDPLYPASAGEIVEDPLGNLGLDVAEAVEEPLNLVLYRTVFVIGDPLRLPSDVAVDGKGKIYILDGTANTVRIYDHNGKPLSTVGDKETLNLPLGLDVSPAGDVLVADSGNHRIVLFPAKQGAPEFFDLPTPPGGKATDPTDVVFGQQLKKFFVVDNDNHRVIALDMKGKILWSSGKMGRNPEEFRFPFMLDKDNKDNLYIVEVVNTRIQVLNKDGAHLKFIGDWGIEKGQFFRPKGIAVSENNELLVSDSYLGIIQVFTHGGTFIGAVGDEAGNLRKFTTPIGMTVSGDRLFVIEMYTNRLIVLEREGP
ncbi:MAG: NHL repeat-containing protein [Proteobacteria bacterium]|nr:NHL repeat-containing protein [Pseudomonadota bacterium]MBU1057098.1 NHL repeat-containing protein [Pseudomonadota bacterium]